MLPDPATRSTLSRLIARRLIDCLLICFYEKSSDKQFVQLEEIDSEIKLGGCVRECFSEHF